MIYLLVAWAFLKIGLFAIGGGLVTVPFLFDLAEQYGWFNNQELTDIIAIAGSLPGPVGINMAAYAGFYAANLGGGILAPLCEALPSMLIIYIIVRLLKRRFQYVPIGVINMVFDACVAVLTAVVFRNINQALYCGVAVFVTGRVMDAVVYSFDFSNVALIVTPKYEEVARRLGEELQRGATFLNGEGSYSHQHTKVVLTAVKKQQIADMKQLVVEVDPNAFIIVQEAHQVLGDGFTKYSKDAL